MVQALSNVLRLITIILFCSAIILVAPAEQSTVAAQGATDEFFYSVTPIVYDSDSDGYDDSVILEMDADTTGGYIDVTADLYVADSLGFPVVYDTLTWDIYDEESEYSEFEVTITAGDPQYFDFYLDLYDDQYNWEDTWESSFYLYPLGYGTTTYPTWTPFVTPFPTATPGFRTPFPTATPGGIPAGDGGLSGGAVGGIIAAGLILVLAAVFFGSRIMRGRRTADARIRELRAQMERWRQEGYDVSELEDLFR